MPELTILVLRTLVDQMKYRGNAPPPQKIGVSRVEIESIVANLNNGAIIFILKSRDGIIKEKSKNIYRYG